MKLAYFCKTTFRKRAVFVAFVDIIQDRFNSSLDFAIVIALFEALAAFVKPFIHR